MPTALLKVEEILRAFSDTIENHDYLEIDGMLEESLSIKVLNHEKKSAYSVSVEAILKQGLGEVIEALETGIRHKLYSISRIVGYYSRISSWNDSKKSELISRIKGREAGGYYINRYEHEPHHLKEAIKTVERLPRD